MYVCFPPPQRFPLSPLKPPQNLPKTQKTQNRFVFQGVHQLLQFSSSAEGAGRPWQPGEKKYCKCVFIGKNLDRKELNDGFKACLAAEQTA